MSSDRSDVQYAAKEVCTKMASPTRGSWKRLKEAGRYLDGVEKVTWKMGSWKNDDEVNVDVPVDSNWAGGLERKWTSGGMMMINGHSREILVQNISDECTEYGRSPVLRSRHRRSRGTWNAVDDGRLGRDHPSASFGLIPSLLKAMVSRRGLGKTRHLELMYLWLQEVTKSGRVKMRRIPGEQNLADHLTREKAWHQIETLIRGVQSEESCI